jgi:tetratricopeptide (TPR) repeat protein
MDSLWEEGARYLEQIASLARKWRDSQNDSQPLKPTVDLCNLMADCAWFVHDNDAAGVMSLTINTGYDAYYKLDESSKDRLLEADVLLIVCLKDLRVEGDFQSAEAQGKKSLAIRDDMSLPQDLEMTNCYNYIAIACDSMGRHEEAATWLSKSRGILEGHDDELHTRLLCQNNLNFSRNKFSVGDYQESERMLDEACVQATRFKSWCSLSL